MKTLVNNNQNIESKNNQVFNSRKEQYEAIKYGRPWYLLLFYWGAHYAAYDKDAETVAEVLDGMDGVTTYEECGMKCTVFPVDALAEARGTIGYEILTSLGRRYHRVYTGGEAAMERSHAGEGARV